MAMQSFAKNFWNYIIYLFNLNVFNTKNTFNLHTSTNTFLYVTIITVISSLNKISAQPKNTICTKNKASPRLSVLCLLPIKISKL